MEGDMDARRDKAQAPKRWPYALTGVGILAGFCALVLWGIGWGIPSERRKELEGTPKELLEMPRALQERSTQEFGTHGRRTAAARPYPRHLFNSVRSYHPDEYLVFKSLSNMAPGRLDFDPGSYIYPSLHTYLVGAVAWGCWKLGVVHVERDLLYYVDRPEEMGRLYLVGRALSLLAAVGTLLMVWRMGGRGTGLLAMGLLAAMPAFAVHSHNLTRDTCAALAVLVLFAACRRLAETGKARWYDIAGGAAGVCMGFQYFAAALWVMIPVAGLLWAYRRGESRRAVVSGSWVSLLVMLAVFFVVCPYHLLNSGRFLSDFASVSGHMAGTELLARLDPMRWGTHLFRMMPALVTWPMAFAVFVGAVVVLGQRRQGDVLLLVWLAAWAVVVGLDGRSYSRYYVPLLAGLALLAARGLAGGWDAVRRLIRARRVAVPLAAVALVAVAGPAAAMTFAWCRLYSRVNVRTLAGEAIAADVPSGATVGMTKWPWQFEMPPIDLDRYRPVVLEDSPRQLAEDWKLLDAKRPDYFVGSSLQFGSMLSPEEAEREADSFWTRLLHGERLYRQRALFRVPLTVFGSEIDLGSYPEDMQYVNPVICVLELREELRGPPPTATALRAPAANPGGRVGKRGGQQ